MKLILFIYLSVFSCFALLAQRNISDWSNASSENISVERLAGDSLTTSFLIQIREYVPLHYHAVHSEHVYILSGKGEFVMNADTTRVSEGMYLFIPSKSTHSVEVTSRQPMRVLSIQCPEFTGADRIKVP